MPTPATPRSRRTSTKHDRDTTPIATKTPESGHTSERKQATSKPVDIGKPIGQFDTESVREKVRKWQMQGGGVVTANDPVAEAESGATVETEWKARMGKTKEQPSTAPATPAAPEFPHKQSEALRSESMSRSHRPGKHNELDEAIRSASAPKKRVISDGRWRKAKSPAALATGSPNPKEVQEHVQPDDDGIRIIPSPLEVDSENLRKASRTAHREGHGRSQSRSAQYRDVGKAAESSNHKIQSPTATPSPPQTKDAAKDGVAHSKSKDRARSRSPEVAQPKPPQVFGSRIEAWLTSTPDPFVDTVELPKKSPRTSTKTSRRKSDDYPARKIGEDRLASNSDMRESERRASGHSKKKTKQDHGVVHDFIESTTELDAIPPAEPRMKAANSDRSPCNSTPTLKRSRATKNTRSPVKELPKVSSDRGNEGNQLTEPSIPSSFDDATDLTESQADTVPDFLPMKRQFPSTGKRLSTIVSVETSNTRAQPLAPSSVSEVSTDTASSLTKLDDSQASESGNTVKGGSANGIRRGGKNRKRRLTKHSDLISVLSMPQMGNKSIVSARSIRTYRSRLETATMEDLLKEVSSDEKKYMRELRTLVDGVIPVLLTCVLSKSDSAVAAGLFSRAAAASSDQSLTRPIVDMGIVLERLKSLHKRVPTTDPSAFLLWAQGAQRVYADYLKVWRLGFQDVVVNLAPATEGDKSDPAWDDGLSRNEDGYIINGDGERVDVAFLLKRPLVRLKYLAKTLKGINFLKPSEQAASLAAKYQDLVAEARKRSNEERSRLEDEAAAAIDPTRARDPRSLAPLAGVSIDPSRCVRARDYFDMHLPHSSGQRVDCRVEMLLRDDRPEQGSGGDVLICEVDNTGRWLFFPPIKLSRISARMGGAENEVIVMIRGLNSGGQEWHEVLSLKSNDEQAAGEWVQMIGSSPVPLELARTKSFVEKHRRRSSDHGTSVLSSVTSRATPLKSRTPSPREIDIPIGEQATEVSKVWSANTPSRSSLEKTSPRSSQASVSPEERERSKGNGRRRSSSLKPTPSTPRKESELKPSVSNRASLPPETETPTRNHHSAKSVESLPTLKRTRARRYSRHFPVPGHSSPAESKGSFAERAQRNPEKLSPSTPKEGPNVLRKPSKSLEPQKRKDFRVWFPSSDAEDLDEPEEPYAPVRSNPEFKAAPRPQPKRRTSAVPSLDLPTIPKVRKSSQPSTPKKSPPPAAKPSESQPLDRGDALAASAPAKLQKRPSGLTKSKDQDLQDDKPPPPPVHRSPPVSVQNKLPPKLHLGPNLPDHKGRRRSSSPLKHEYEPSTATESSSDSPSSASEEDPSITSESEDEDLEHGDATKILPPLASIPKPNKSPVLDVSPPESLPSLPNVTLAPSQSASQSPYRTVPHQTGKAAKTIASIFSWSDKGAWERLHPDECSVVITPGLIEAFQMSAAHSWPAASKDNEGSSTSGTDERPLVALELTPLVPLRRGTALDISIRSPLTPNSRIKGSSNIMFRSRSPEECEILYGMINFARINNPTYIALQNARGPYGESSWGATMDRRNSFRAGHGGSAGSTTGSTWWASHFGSSSRSYRASSTRTPSIAATDSSIGTMASAFSALKRFSGSGRLFNVARSTISSRAGSGSGGSYEASSSGSSTPAGAPPMPMGISTSKIRLYLRETQSKWRDLGSARLMIMNPSTTTPAGNASAGPGSPALKQHGLTGHEKRIVINGKTKGECLLDVTLGESCFERVARTGIAVSVWEELVGPNGEIGQVAAEGGVAGARVRVYMIQMKSERECAYSFSLLGKLRY